MYEKPAVVTKCEGVGLRGADVNFDYSMDRRVCDGVESVKLGASEGKARIVRLLRPRLVQPCPVQPCPDATNNWHGPSTCHAGGGKLGGSGIAVSCFCSLFSLPPRAILIV
jgi:hypothetical protein